MRIWWRTYFHSVGLHICWKILMRIAFCVLQPLHLLAKYIGNQRHAGRIWRLPNQFWHKTLCVEILGETEWATAYLMLLACLFCLHDYSSPFARENERSRWPYGVQGWYIPAWTLIALIPSCIWRLSTFRRCHEHWRLQHTKSHHCFCRWPWVMIAYDAELSTVLLYVKMTSINTRFIATPYGFCF